MDNRQKIGDNPYQARLFRFLMFQLQVQLLIWIGELIVLLFEKTYLGWELREPLLVWHLGKQLLLL